MTKLSTVCIRRVPSLAVIGLALSGVVSGAQDIPPTVIRGHERLTWDQPVQTSVELAEYEFRAQIDGTRVEALEDVRCASQAQVPGFECSARLPALAPGLHTIELAARRQDLSQGPWSAPLRVSRHSELTASAPSQRAGLWVDGARLESVPLAGRLDITSLATLPDGRVLVGDRGGRILMVDGDRVTECADLRAMARGEKPELLAIAAHRDFAINRSIVVAYAVRSGLRVARLTESTGVLVSHEVIREGLPIDRREAAAAIGIGPDRKIYVATGGEAGSRDPYAGKVLRMNADGSTPTDGWPAPVFAEGTVRPVALSWSSDDRTLWIIGVSAHGTAAASALNMSAGGVARRYLLPNGAAASGVRRAGSLDELLVPTDDGRSLLRLSSDASATIVASEWLFRNLFDGIVAVGVGGGDAVWVATRERLIRVTLPQ